MDIDAFVSTQSSIKSAIRRVADKHGLPDDWMNSDFKYTNSFSIKLLQYSKYYKTFSQVLQVRTIKDEYLIAMKLMAFKSYKHDWSDITDILHENANITLENVYNAFENLYGSLDKLSISAKKFIENEIENPSDLNSLVNAELDNLDLLKDFDEKYQNVLNDSNAEDIIETLNKKANGDVSSNKPHKMNLFQVLL